MAGVWVVSEMSQLGEVDILGTRPAQTLNRTPIQSRLVVNALIQLSGGQINLYVKILDIVHGLSI
jgi:hypothetical protein